MGSTAGMIWAYHVHQLIVKAKRIILSSSAYQKGCHVVYWMLQSASYNLFNYVNEVNAEVEALEDSIAKVRAEIEAHLDQVRLHWHT